METRYIKINITKKLKKLGFKFSENLNTRNKARSCSEGLYWNLNDLMYFPKWSRMPQGQKEIEKEKNDKKRDEYNNLINEIFEILKEDYNVELVEDKINYIRLKE